PVLGQRERVAVGAVLDIARLPIPAPVAVGVVVAGDVLVHQPVVIVVEALASEQRPLPLLVGIARDEQPRILRRKLPAAFGIGLPPLGDVAVAVEIVWQVRVRLAVSVL